MRRIERDGYVAYRDRRWGWSLVLFCGFPFWLLLLQEGLARHDGRATVVMAGSALATIVASFALMRTNTLLIDRRGGALIHARSRFVWGARRDYPLSEVKSVGLGAQIIEHSPFAARGEPGWTETECRVVLETKHGQVPIHDHLSGETGRRLAVRLSEDLGVRIRRHPY
jgi:hypothetical protein